MIEWYFSYAGNNFISECIIELAFEFLVQRTVDIQANIAISGFSFNHSFVLVYRLGAGYFVFVTGFVVALWVNLDVGLSRKWSPIEHIVLASPGLHCYFFSVVFPGVTLIGVQGFYLFKSHVKRNPKNFVFVVSCRK